MTRAVLAFLLLVGASPVIAQGALTVTSVSPSDGAVGIPLAQIIRISFSDELDLTTVTSDTVFLTDSLGNVVQSQFSFSTTQVELRRLSSTDLLLPDETYTVHVTTGVTDVLGNTLESEYASTFATRIISGPLRVTAVLPSNGAKDIPLARIVRISFSDELDLTTVTGDTVFLTDSLGNVVQSQFSFSTTQVDLRRLSSTDLLLPDETYTVHVTTGVTDVLGNTLKSEFTSTFATRIISGPLRVISVSPSDGETGTPLARIVRTSFSNELDHTTVTGDTVFLTDSLGNVVQSQFSFSTTQVELHRLSSTDRLLPDETYTVHVTTGVTDVLGNTLKSEFTSTFTTR